MNRDEAFTARNRAKIPILIVLATVNYWIATVIAAVAGTITVIFAAIIEGGDIPTDEDVLVFLGIAILVIVALAAVIATVYALVRLPFLRRRLERQMLTEAQARIATPDDYPEVRNLLAGLAIAAGNDVPRFAIIEDVSANSFSVGTNPENTIVGVTTGMIDQLTRDELEAVLAYEVSRIDSFDVALLR